MSVSAVYTCVKCGETMTEHDLEDRGGNIKCIHCGYKVLRKNKPPVVKRVQAI